MENNYNNDNNNQDNNPNAATPNITTPASTTTTNTTSNNPNNNLNNNPNNNLNNNNNQNRNYSTSTTTSRQETGIRNSTPKKVIYYILAVLEILFAFRLVLKLLGANPESGFVAFIYSITQVFLYPFIAIFRSASTDGIETKAVLEPSTIIGMIVYAIIAVGIVKLIYINRNENRQ